MKRSAVERKAIKAVELLCELAETEGGVQAFYEFLPQESVEESVAENWQEMSDLMKEYGLYPADGDDAPPFDPDPPPAADRVPS